MTFVDWFLMFSIVAILVIQTKHGCRLDFLEKKVYKEKS